MLHRFFWAVLTALVLALHAAPAAARVRAPAPDFRIPGEFERVAAVWLGWDAGHEAFTADLAVALAPHVPLRLLVASEELVEAARSSLERRGLDTARIAFAVDPRAIYFARDATVFAVGQQGELGVVDFRWTHYGWAGWCRRVHAGNLAAATRCAAGADLTRDTLSNGIARLAPGHLIASRLAIEGGGIEVNGRGTIIANEELFRQRNPRLGRAAIERELRRLPGVRKVIWLPQGLAEDPLHRSTIVGRHVGWGTGGHTDEFVRFADHGTVLLAWPEDGEADTHPVARLNRERMQRNLEVLSKATDQDGRPLRVVKVPLPRIIERDIVLRDDADEAWSDQWSPASFPAAEQRQAGQTVTQVASASYLNFVVANGVVVLPDYLRHGTPEAVQSRVRSTFEQVFPGRTIRFVDAIGANWVGGGAHCATLSQPGSVLLGQH